MKKPEAAVTTAPRRLLLVHGQSRLEVPAGAHIEQLRCVLCGAVMGVVIIPHAPPLPFEVKTMLKPFLRYVTRKLPELRDAMAGLLEGRIGELVAVLRESEQIGAIVPTACAACVSRPGSPTALEERT